MPTSSAGEVKPEPPLKHCKKYCVGTISLNFQFSLLKAKIHTAYESQCRPTMKRRRWNVSRGFSSASNDKGLGPISWIFCAYRKNRHCPHRVRLLFHHESDNTRRTTIEFRLQSSGKATSASESLPMLHENADGGLTGDLPTEVLLR